MQGNSTVRYINQQRLLKNVQLKGAMSRADIARDLELMRSTSSSLVAELIRMSILREVAIPAKENGGNQREVGRPGRLVELNPDYAWFLGAEVAVGSIRLVAIDLQGQLRTSLTRNISESDQNPLNTIRILRELFDQIVPFKTHDRLIQLCVSIPGTISREGKIKHAPLLGWKDIEFHSILTEQFPEVDKIRCENDANAFAHSQILKVGSNLPSDTLFMWLDSGIGGAIWTDGKLLRGKSGFAGEFGHFHIKEPLFDQQNPLAGSLDQLLGRKGLLSTYHRLGGTADDIETFLNEIKNNSASASGAVHEWSTSLAHGLAIMTNAFNPSAVVFGGPLTRVLSTCINETKELLEGILVDPEMVPELLLSNSGPESAALGCGLVLCRDFSAFDEHAIFKE